MNMLDELPINPEYSDMTVLIKYATKDEDDVNDEDEEDFNEIQSCQS